jgi:glycosyltransferase involved in cell wall biosynthesis
MEIAPDRTKVVGCLEDVIVANRAGHIMGDHYGVNGPMKLSVIIPAFNEEKLLPGCLAQVGAALRASASAGWSAEVIVCDNNSTDRTAQLARKAGAHVVFEPVNQISRARNAGAQAASGDWLLFIVADSHLHPSTLSDLLRATRHKRCAGGGCVVGLDEAPLAAHAFVGVWNLLSRALLWAAGSFVFCQREAFEQIGGFSVDLFAAEEIAFSEALKRWARSRGQQVVILRRHAHVSSGRKFRLYGRWEIAALGLRGLVLPRSILRDRSRLGYFYDSRR